MSREGVMEHIIQSDGKEKKSSSNPNMHEETTGYPDTRKELLFINVSDPTSGKSKDSRKAVRSYVARIAHRKSRCGYDVKLDHGSDTGERRKERWHARPVQAERPEGFLHGGSKPEKQIPDMILYTSHAISGEVYSPVKGLNNGSSDPFQTTAVRLSRFEEYLVSHFVRFVVPGTAAYYPRSSAEPDYQQSMSLHWMPLAMADATVMNGLFSESCRNLALLYKADRYLDAAFRYNEKLIQSVRESVSNEAGADSSDSTIVKVLLLASAEFHIGNLAGTRKHLDAVAELVKLKGGLHNLGLDGFLRQLVLWHDRTSSIYTALQPNFAHPLEFDESALTNSISPGFRDQFILLQLSGGMINILNSICAYTDYIYNLQLPWSDAKHRALISSANEIEVRLLVLRSGNQNGLPKRKQTLIEECLCLSLNVFVTLMPHEHRFPPMGCRHLSRAIGEVLSRLMQAPLWHQQADLYLWLAFMGGIVARAGELKESDLPEFFAQLRKQGDVLPRFENEGGNDSTLWIFRILKVCSLLGLSSKEDITSHLRRFLWVDSLCEPYAVDIWSGIEAMKVAVGVSRQVFEAAEL